MKQWSLFLALGIAFLLLALIVPPFTFSEGMIDDSIARSAIRTKGKPKKNKSSNDREKERLREIFKKRDTFKDLVDKQEEYQKFFTLFYQKDATIDKEERIFLDFKRAELQLDRQNVQQLEEQVVTNGQKILSMEEDRSKE